MTEEQIKQLLDLIEQWTRAEIVARLVPFDNKEFANYAQIQIEKENEIRRLIFGTDDLVELGIKWNLLKSKEEQKKIDAKAEYKRLQKELAALLRE